MYSSTRTVAYSRHFKTHSLQVEDVFLYNLLKKGKKCEEGLLAKTGEIDVMRFLYETLTMKESSLSALKHLLCFRIYANTLKVV